MHISYKALVVLLCAAFSAPVHAEDFVSLVEQNFPYREVDQSYGIANIQEGRCQEGTPFVVSQEASKTGTKLDIARQIHARLRALGANAFSTTDMKEDARGRSIVVTPLTCDLV